MNHQNVIWEFRFYGEPVPKARPRFVRKKWGVMTYEPKTSREFSNAMKQAMAKEWSGMLLEERPIHLGIFIWKSRPKTLPKSVKYPIRRPDLDNYIKMVLDCMIGTVIKDDSMVVSIEAEKGFLDKPHIHVLLSYIKTGT